MPKKRMEQHNHNMNHMMKKDALKKVENALRKRKTSSAKVPLLMGLGLPVLAKRFLNSFQVIITFAAIYNGTVSVPDNYLYHLHHDHSGSHCRHNNSHHNQQSLPQNRKIKMSQDDWADYPTWGIDKRSTEVQECPK